MTVTVTGASLSYPPFVSPLAATPCPPPPISVAVAFDDGKDDVGDTIATAAVTAVEVVSAVVSTLLIDLFFVFSLLFFGGRDLGLIKLKEYLACSPYSFRAAFTIF